MVRLIEEHREALRALRRQYCVARLEVFGSAATGEDFDAESDVDFLVEFQPLEPGEHARCYLTVWGIVTTGVPVVRAEVEQLLDEA